jgi:hypothetical protein
MEDLIPEKVTTQEANRSTDGFPEGGIAGQRTEERAGRRAAPQAAGHASDTATPLSL